MTGRRARGAAAAAAVVLAAAGCGASSASGSVAPGGSVVPSEGTAASASPGPSRSPSEPPQGTPPSPAASATSVAVDPALLEILPDAVDGIPLQFSPDASSQVAADPELVGEVERVAYAVAVDAAEEELLVVAVASLAPGVFGDDYFRTWRDQYDREVCAQAGGVREAGLEVSIDGRPVFVRSCVDGGSTYHVWLADRDLLVSAVSFGDRALGQRLVETLDL